MTTERELLTLAAKACGMVSYDPETGLMTWLKKPSEEKDYARWNSRYALKECGTVDDKGYRRILIRFVKGKTFKIRTHRLAWFIYYGKFPDGELDHINQNKTDNRIANLRDVTKNINQKNGTRKCNNTSGVPGVTWHKQRKKWCAQFGSNGKHFHIGLFDDLSEAELAVREARATHGFTENHGRAI